MKTSELRNLIREEAKKMLNEAEQPVFKVGDRVMVSQGPMKSYIHKVIAIVDGLDGSLTYNIQPILQRGTKNSYRLGAVGVKADELSKHKP